MRINSLNIAFKGKVKQIADKQNSEEKLGYSDINSDIARVRIREFQEDKYFARENLLSKEYHLSEYELNNLIGKMITMPKEVNYEEIAKMPIPNVHIVGENLYRGAALVDNLKCVETLKKAGIQRVVDLIGYKSYKEAVLANGMEYFSPNFGHMSGFWFDEACFSTYQEYLDFSSRWAWDDIDRKNIKKMVDEEFPKEVEKSKANVIEFIKFMQKGYLYIGCDLGTYKTDMALLLNNALNPN